MRRKIMRCAWLGVLAVFMLFSGGCSQRETPVPESPVTANMAASGSLRAMGCPTDRTPLTQDDPAAFQPTASGRPESALFGSVRTKQRGRALVPSFHEGIDIAPLHTDARGRPQDSIYAVAAGAVAYVNRVAGNSTYGKYVVLVHESSVGRLYTLYAHLSRVAPGIKTGRQVQAGEVLGIMGNTALSPFPLARAHLHFEIGLIINAHFNRWYHTQKLKPDHGIYHGWNLLGINPLEVLRRQRDNPAFTFATHLETIPRAFEVVFIARRLPDYFRRYPKLWAGPVFGGRAIVMAVSENGVPLRGWNATEADARELGKKKWQVRNVNTEALGRNGCRLIVCRKGQWNLASNGKKWLKILTYP